MELDWALKAGAILYIFNGINLLVTVMFRASVTAQPAAPAAPTAPTYSAPSTSYSSGGGY